MSKKVDIIEMIEQTSKECCDALNKTCLDLVEKHGYNTKSLKKCKTALKKDGLGIVFNYAYKNEFIYLWWELHKYEKNKPIEKIDESEKIKVVTKVER